MSKIDPLLWEEYSDNNNYRKQKKIKKKKIQKENIKKKRKEKYDKKRK